MQLFNHNKKIKNTDSFGKANYSVLDYEQLLLVNGAGGSSGGSSGPTGPSSTSSQTSTGSKFVENSNQGVANANVGDKIQRNDGTIVTLTQADIDWAKSKITSEKNTGASTPSITTNTETAKDKISSSISNNSNQKYNANGNGYKCDNWVEEVLTDAGYDSKKYLTAGKASVWMEQALWEL